jgi:hypothetical protein
MARKTTLNLKELRAASEAAERSASKSTSDQEPKKKPARKSRAKADKQERRKAFWGVFNQSLRRVALFEYHQRKEAEKKAKELSESSKTPHFVRPVKEAVVEGS